MRTESATTSSGGAAPASGTVAPAAKPAAQATPAAGRSFGEVLRGARGDDTSRDGAAERDGLGGPAGERGRRGFSLEPEADGAFAAFRVPAGILQAPPAIVRPTFEHRGGAAAAQAIADRVVERVRLEASPTGRLEFVLETKADVLGGVEIRVRVEAGQVHATFATAHPEARATLEAQLGVLREAMVAKGLQVAEVSTTEPRRPPDERGRERREGRGSQEHHESSPRDER